MASPGITSPFSRVRPIGTGTSQSRNTTLILTRRTTRRRPTRFTKPTTAVSTTPKPTTMLPTTSKLPPLLTLIEESTTDSTTTVTAPTTTTKTTNTTTANPAPTTTKSAASTDRLTQPNVAASLSPLYISVGVLAAVVVILAILAMYFGVYRKKKWQEKQRKKTAIAAEMLAVHSQLQVVDDVKPPAGLSVSNTEYERIDEYESAMIYDEIREVPSDYQCMMSTGMDNHLYAETEPEQYEEPISSRKSSSQPSELSPSADNHAYQLTDMLPVQEEADLKKASGVQEPPEDKTVSCDTEDLSANHIYHEVIPDTNSCQEETDPEEITNLELSQD